MPRLLWRSQGGGGGSYERGTLVTPATVQEMLARAELVFKAHKLVYHSTLGCRVIKKKKKDLAAGAGDGRAS